MKMLIINFFIMGINTNIFSSVSSIKGVGEKIEEAFTRLSVKRIIDLLLHFPSSILHIKYMPKLFEIKSGDHVVLELTIEKIDEPTQKLSRFKPFKIHCKYGFKRVTLTYFNHYPFYVVKDLKIGCERMVYGRIEKFGEEMQIIHPDYIIPLDKLTIIPKIQAIYPLTYGLNQRLLQKNIEEALKITNEVKEWLPSNLLNSKNWPSFKEALLNIHHPEGLTDISPNSRNIERIAFDELLASQLAIQMMRKYKKQDKPRTYNFTGNLANKILQKLGFILTEGQAQAVAEITQDQLSSHRMMRLLQGDVGSGKTLVSLIAMLNMKEAGMQCALMAPTDILASQHYEWFLKACGEEDIKIALLTGKVKGKERSKILEKLQKGEIDFLIGTHALFQEKVIFKNLALCIIDEQHRFGVKQRASLASKGDRPDILVMSATPIPRTLSLTIYGDLDLSTILDKPKGRKPIKTSLLSTDRKEEIIASIKKAIDANHRIYWVCPLIEEKEEEETQVATTEKRYKEFLEIFPDKVALVHGKMKPQEKEDNVLKFARGEVQILVATTVIEVGIDVPEATIIVIEEAQKFGLAQLHQLRGRVGRGERESYCVLLFSKPISKVSIERLQALKENNNGFELAEIDLKLRGDGDLVGTKQSGVPEYRVADLFIHFHLLSDANKYAKKILENDPELTTAFGSRIRTLMRIFNYIPVEIKTEEQPINNELKA